MLGSVLHYQHQNLLEELAFISPVQFQRLGETVATIIEYVLAVHGRQLYHFTKTLYVGFLLICHPDVDPPPVHVQMIDYTKHSGPWTDQERTNVLEAQKWWMALMKF